MAASYYGVPRTTVDVDFIVQLSEGMLDSFLDTLDKFGLEVDKGRVQRQLRAGYNTIRVPDKYSLHRADFIVQTVGRLERRRGRALGLRAYYQPPELLILAKLRMIKATRPLERSYKDREDIREILASTKVNRRRILRFAAKESTGIILKEILRPRGKRVPLKTLRELKGLQSP